MIEKIKLKLQVRILLIRIKLINWLIKDDYEMQYLPRLYDAPLMIFITSWLIDKIQQAGFVGDVYRFFDRDYKHFDKLLEYSSKILEDWVKAYYEDIGEDYIPFFT